MEQTASRGVQFGGVEERDSELLLEFVDEASDQLESVEAALLAFERNPTDRAHLATAARGLHSLKGSAGYVALMDVQELCHESEELLGALPSSSLTETKQRLDLALDAVSVLRDRLEDVRRSCHSNRALRVSSAVQAFLRRAQQVTRSRKS